jgi:putative transposase
MVRNRVKLQRHSLRLENYGYDQPGGYFVTTCTFGRENLFGEIQDGSMRLNRYGEIVRECLKSIPEHFDNAEVDQFVVMPNHVHSIVVIMNVGARHAVPVPSLERFGKPMTGSLSTIVRSFKSATTKHINNLRQSPGTPVWQRNYYEHVIRNEQSLHRIREYIANNPARWDFDRENPAATNPEPQDVWRG